MAGDISDRPGYDLFQVRSICEVQVRPVLFVTWLVMMLMVDASIQFATLLHAGGFDLPTGTSLEELD